MAEPTEEIDYDALDQEIFGDLDKEIFDAEPEPSGPAVPMDDDDDDDEEEEEEEARPAAKRQRKGTSAPKSKSKKPKKRWDEAEEVPDVAAEAVERTREQEMTCMELVARMKRAVEDDHAANRDGKPALERLKMLREVSMCMKNVKLQSILIRFRILDCLRDWLSPLPDGSFPGLELRTEIFKAIDQMPFGEEGITTEDLKESKIGKFLMFYATRDFETQANKELLQKTTDRWIRPVFGLETNHSKYYSERLQLEPQQQIMSGRKRATRPPPNLSSSNANAKPGEKGYRKRAWLPEAMKMEFRRMPKANAVEKEARADAAHRTFLRNMSTKKSKKRSTGQAVSISIEGRGL